LYDAIAGALLLTRLAAEPAVSTQPIAWLLMMSTLDPEKRETWSQGRLF
jgi:DNA polymerase-3 subunit epsilon